MRTVDWIFIGLLIPALAMMSLIFLVNAFEFAEIFWPGNLKRRFGSRPLPEGTPEPRVSIHLACCNEQPDMVIDTIRSLQNLDYRNFEVLVIDNNTRDEGALEACRGVHGDARRALPLLSPAEVARLQGRRAELRADADRPGGRNRRRRRCRLQGRIALAEGPGRSFRRSEDGGRPGAAGAPALEVAPVPPDDELRVRRLLSHRHAPSQRAQRDHPARHDDAGARRSAAPTATGPNGASAKTPSSACG